MPLLGFALAVAFVPGWYGAATTPRWALIAVAVPLILLFTRPQRHITAAHAFGLAVIGWAAVSMIWTANVYDGFDQLLQYLFLAGVFVLGARTADLKPVMIGFTWGIAVSSAIALVQWLGHWGWIVWPHGYAPSGLFINENYLAEPAALCLVAVVAYRQWYLIPLLLPSLVFTNSRSAVAGIAGAAAVWAWRWLRYWTFPLAAFLLAILVLSSLKPHATTYERLDIWQDTVTQITLFGHGLGSFSTLFPNFTKTIEILAQRPENAHNDFLEVAFELGLVGFAALVGLCFVAIRGSEGTARYLVVAFLTMCFFDQASHLPASAFVGALALGHLARDRRSLRDSLMSGRISLQHWFRRAPSWAGGGLVAAR